MHLEHDFFFSSRKRRVSVITVSRYNKIQLRVMNNTGCVVKGCFPASSGKEVKVPSSDTAIVSFLSLWGNTFGSPGSSCSEIFVTPACSKRQHPSSMLQWTWGCCCLLSPNIPLTRSFTVPYPNKSTLMPVVNLVYFLCVSQD